MTPTGYDTKAPTIHHPPPAFSVAAVITKSWKVFATSPRFYLSLACIASVPMLAIEYLLPASIPFRNDVETLASTFFTCVFEGAASYAAYRSLLGKRAEMKESVRRGMAKYPALVCVSLVVALTILVGNRLYIVPGLLALPFVVFAVPACVVEGLGVWSSLRRGVSLGAGYYGKALGLIVLYIFVFLLFFVGGGVLTALILHVDVTENALARRALMIVPDAVWLVMAPVMYFELRTVKEGVTVRKLIDVFA